MKHVLITLFTVALVSCQSPTENQTTEPETEVAAVSNSEEKVNLEFWNRLANLKGKAFKGEVLEAPEGDDFRGKKLVMQVLDVKKDTIYIPFNVGENRSRTWILTKTKNGIQLKHDHRQEDGKEDEVTM